jgi:predicted DNA binding protein
MRPDMENTNLQLDIQLIQSELDRVMNSDLLMKSDKKLEQYQNLSDRFKGKNKGIQASGLIPYNRPENRSTCKLTRQQVENIRKKYVPNQYGMAKLAKEYGVSKSVIMRILRGQSWK